ncbi:AMP-binding protein [Micromonospora sp. NPDC049559]|uniref:AMP-binding protein n=1 Tax=Micromonospora sp. NPDC049559 TaxID=3155923 RepID=UPI00341AF328
MLSTNIVERLVGRQLALGRGDEIAYVDAAGQITYAGLHRAVRSYAARLAAAGIEPGARGLIVADDSIPTVVAVLALWWRGAVAVPVSTMLTRAEIEFIAGDCGAGFLHVDARSDQLVAPDGGPGVPRGTDEWAVPGSEPAPPPAVQQGSDVVLVQYTSGSTGTPKGVLHTRAGIDAVLDGFGRILDLRPEDTVLSTAKLSFGYGFGNSLLFPLAAGARAVLSSGPPDVYRLRAAVARHRPTVLCAVPRVYAALLQQAGGDAEPSLGAVRLAVSAGEHLPAPICAGFVRTFGTPLVNGLGATEVLHIVVATRGASPGSTGRAVPGVRISVRDEWGSVVPDGTEGRLHVAGDCVAAGYLDRPEATSRTFADGGAYTGDVVRREPDGEIRYVCRHDDLLNLGGHKVSPFDIEAAVRDLAGVAQCAVAGTRDGAGLEQAVAYVVPAPGTDGEALRRVVVRAFRERLPAFKRPSSVEIVEQLPVTSTGKLARFRLRAGTAAPGAQVRMRVLRDGPGRTLVCIPYAGGSSGAFTRLARHLPRSWRVVAGEASYPDGVTIGEAATAWWRAVAPYLSDDSVLFGHSLGAVLAAAVANAAGAELGGAQVVLSAPPVPSPGGPAGPVPGADDETLLDGLRRAGLLPGTSLSPEEISRLLLPRFRRDIALAPNGFEITPAAPVHVLVGTDDGLCTRDALTARLPGNLIASIHSVPGDHYFVATNAAGTAEVLMELFH